MGRQARHKRERRRTGSASISSGWSVVVLRREWLHRRVRFDAGRGDGLQEGMVTEITEDGVIFVECMPGQNRRVAAIVLTADYLSRLTPVE